MHPMNELAAFLKAHDNYVVIGHIFPDGDASGSCIALCQALHALGKRAFVYLPGGLPKLYAGFECPVEIVSGPNLPFTPETALVADVSEANRMGDAKAIYDACSAHAVIDHHATNPGFGEVCVVDGDAAACGEMVVQLLDEMQLPLTRSMAEWLYIAITTDCGQFGYSSTRAETMEAAAECLRAGIDVDSITREVFRTRSEARTRLLGMVLSGMQRSEDGLLCWARLTQDMFDQAHATREDNEGIVNYLLEIRGVQLAFLAEERGANASKFSLRSKAPLDVAATVAVPLGGGGHACAAGVTIEAPLEDALKIVHAKAQEALYKFKEQE